MPHVDQAGSCVAPAAETADKPVLQDPRDGLAGVQLLAPGPADEIHPLDDSRSC